MKNSHSPLNWFFTVFSFLVVLFTVIQTAQAGMIGTYTINPAQPASGKNYQNFASATSDLSAQGVSGTVVFNVSDGIYKESINIGGIYGVSTTNSITIQSASGDSSKVVIQPTTASQVINISNTPFITISRITINQTNTGGYYAIHINGCDHSNLIGCRVIKSNNDAFLIYSEGYSGKNLYSGNFLSGGSYAIYDFEGMSTIPSTIINNKISNCYSGIYVSGYAGYNIINNNIQLDVQSPLINNFGMNLNLIRGHTAITGNKVNVNAGQTAMNLNGCIDTGTSFSMIANNMIVGYVSVQYCNHMGFYFNNILVNWMYNNSLSGVMFSSSNYSAVTKNKFYNNNIVNLNGSPCLNYQPNYNSLYADYNNYFTTGPVLAVASGTNYYKMSIWSIDNEIDANSISIYPGYFSKTDLHQKNFLLYHKGTPIPGITVDFDGDSRDQKTPDIGADEFIPVANDLTTIQVLNLIPGLNCGDSIRPTIFVFNNGYNVATNVPVILSLNKNQKILRDTISYIGSGGGVLFQFKNPLNTIKGGDFTVKAYTALPNDADRSDDTITLSGFIIPGAYPPKVNDVLLCHPNQYPYKTILRAIKKFPTDSLVWTDVFTNQHWNGDSIVNQGYLYIDGYNIQAYSKFKYSAGLKDTSKGKGRFSTKPLPLIITPKINMTLDSVTVYPKNSGSFYINNIKYTVTAVKPGSPVKIKLKNAIMLYANQSSQITIDTILTGGLFASYNGPPAVPVTNALVSVNQSSTDSLYRYLYDLKFTATSCPSQTVKMNVIYTPINLSLQQPAGTNYKFNSGNESDPDMVCGKTIDYNVTTSFADSTYGTQWKISKLTVLDEDQQLTYPYTFTAASKNSPAIVSFILPVSTQYKVFSIQVRAQNLLTGCDTEYRRYFSFEGPIVKILTKGSICSGWTYFDQENSNTTSLLWNFGDSTTSNSLDPFHHYFAPPGEKKLYNLKLTGSNNYGCTTTDSESIEIVGPPIIGFSYIIDTITGTVNFVSDDTTQNRYYWFFGDSLNSIKANTKHTYARSGFYTVQLIVYNTIGCRDTLVKKIFVSKRSGVNLEKAELYKINIYPNPTSKTFYLTYHLPDPSVVGIQLLDMQGKQILILQPPVRELFGTMEHSFILPENLASGTYLLKINIDGHDISKEIVIEH